MDLLMLAYAAATLLHFAHNAVLVEAYPNLPAGITAAWVAIAWLALTSVGAAGWIALRRGHERAGLLAIALWAVLGFAGLLHYRRAPMPAHTTAMNATIWIEGAAAAVLLAATVRRLLR